MYPDGHVEYQERSHSASRISKLIDNLDPQPNLVPQGLNYNNQRVLGNIENQVERVPHLSNENNITRLKQEIEHSKTLIQQYT